MTDFSKMGKTAAILLLATGIALECHLACAEPGAEQGSAAVSAEPSGDYPATDASTQTAGDKPSDASDATDQGDANADDTAQKPEKTGKEAPADIQGTNPNDVNKHPAWRKREADKNLGDMQKLRRSMMQQGAQ